MSAGGPSPGKNYQWNGTRWAYTGPSPGPGYHWDGTRWAGAPSAPSAPAAAGGGGTNKNPPATPATPAATPPSTDPRDPTYWADLAKINFQGSTSISDIDSQIGNAQVARDRALQDLAKSHDQSGKSLREQMASRGLGVSTTSATGLGNLETGYTTNVNRANENYTSLEAQGRDKQKQIQKGTELDSQIEYANAAARAAAAAADQAATAPGVAPAAAAAPSGPKPGPGYVWSPQQNRWVKTGPSPGNNYFWTGTAWKKK